MNRARPSKNPRRQLQREVIGGAVRSPKTTSPGQAPEPAMARCGRPDSAWPMAFGDSEPGRMAFGWGIAVPFARHLRLGCWRASGSGGVTAYRVPALAAPRQLAGMGSASPHPSKGGRSFWLVCLIQYARYCPVQSPRPWWRYGAWRDHASGHWTRRGPVRARAPGRPCDLCAAGPEDVGAEPRLALGHP